MKASKSKSKLMQYTTVPNNKPYNPKIEKALILIALAIIVIAAAFAFSSCNTTSKAYERIAKFAPETQKDTLNLDKRAKQHYKPEPPKTVPGKPVIKTVITENKDRVKRLQNRVDSLIDALAFTNELLNSTPDYDSLKAAIRKEIMKDCKPKETVKETHVTDTVYTPDISCQAELSTLRIGLNEANQTIQKRDDTIADYEKKTDSIKWVIGRFFRLLLGQWWFWIIVLFGGGFAYLKIKGKLF